MTIPSRPAPPPPQQQQRSTTAAPSRYTPTTDWDFCAFGTATGASQQQSQQHGTKQKKPPPPRPPPPKVQPSQLAPIVPALKKPGQPQSINILSSLFGQKRSSSGSSANGKTNASVVQKSSNSSSSSVPIKLLPPPAPLAPPPSSRSGGSSTYGSLASSTGTGTAASSSGDMQLITFDSPPSSPTFTQKSCSDCISVDSFSSDSNYSSPNGGGNMSQAESGFEDDFVASAGGFNQPRSGSAAGMTWGDLIDPFESNGNGRAAVNYAPLPLTTAQVRAPLVNSKLQQSDFIDPLCNGRTVTSKIPTVSMPTIIKPPTVGSGSQKSTPQHTAAASTSLQPLARANLTSGGGGGVFAASKRPTAAAPQAAAVVDYFSTEVDSFDSLPSLPMPTIPPPPPPPSVSSSSTSGVVDIAEEPYGIALYNFEGETDEDLTLKVNEKIYLLRRISDEWYMGRDRRGLVGMFPVNYVEVKVPLSSDEPVPSASLSFSAAPQQRSDAIKVRALYHFAAETPEDLTLREDDLVTVLYQITPEWLYGEVNGRRGQFPANFIEYVPPNLPTKPAASGGV
uniref:Putative cofilin/tropomyosin family drebrinlike protein abp1 n=1 Tax=Anopheles braziliensis TaxID=58242 RepID=A0A2M3YZ52_9DIPT